MLTHICTFWLMTEAVLLRFASVKCSALSAGVLLGIAIRTGSPLSLNLAEPVWKQLAGMNLTIADLSEVGTQSHFLHGGSLSVCY